MRNRTLSRSEIGRLAAGKAWFNMTSRGGVYFVQGTRALYSHLFMFGDRRIRHVGYRPGITPERALSEIGDSRRYKHQVGRVIKLFREKMGLREGASLQ